MKHLLSIPAQISAATLLFTNCTLGLTESHDTVIINKKENAEITSIRGEPYQGMPKDELFRLFKSRCQLLGSQKILNREWVAFRDPIIKSSNNVTTFELQDGKVMKCTAGYVTDPANQNSEYEYNVHQKMDRWFFPTERAWWNGEKVQLLDWHKLRRNQQIVFIIEYVDEINKKFNSNIRVDIDKYLLAIDYYADNCDKNCVGIPLSEAVNTLIINEGKAKEEK